jgi:hypothetical protein
MIAILEDRSALNRPLPHPYSCIEVLLRLAELGSLPLAQKLLKAFEARMAFEGTGRSVFTAQLAGRLKLVHELTGLQGFVSSELIQALARAIRKERMHEAADAVRATSQVDAEHFHRVLSRKAPSLYAAVLPFAQQVFRGSARRKTGSRGGNVLVVVLLLGFFRGLGNSCSEPRRAPEPTPVVAAAESPPSFRVAPALKPTAETTVPPVLVEPQLDQLARVESVIAQELSQSDSLEHCTALGSAWPRYLAALRSLPSGGVSRTHFQDYQRRAARSCQELSFQFAEMP